MLTERLRIDCPKCKEPVTVYSEPGETVDPKTAPRCPDCGTSLYEMLVPASK